MFDEGDTLVMQQRENTTPNTLWNSTKNTNNVGPLTILPVLESVTSDWTNVKDQTYSLGVTSFYDNSFTGCSLTSCTTNQYTLSERTSKARMITMQEATNLGCTDKNRSCPVWMYNYLRASTGYGGTVDGTGDGYWMSSVNPSNLANAWLVYCIGHLMNIDVTNASMGARAVVVIDK